MDVSLSGRRFLFAAIALLSLGLGSCGNRYDLSTNAGQQARIDDANAYLSKGDCADAVNSIGPLYNSQYMNDQVKIIYASAQACYAKFNLLTFASNLASASNMFNGLAISLTSSANDGSVQDMYNAVDVLTQSGSAINAYQRTTADNDYMVFIQLGVIAAIERNYGNPDGSGNKQTNLVYPAGNVSQTDACALAAAFSFISDSYAYSDYSDGTTKSAVSSINSVCTGFGLTSCAQLNRDRTKCASIPAFDTQAGDVVTGVNTAW
jgi:hypothetical protein